MVALKLERFITNTRRGATTTKINKLPDVFEAISGIG
jgi:hypothetical protein